jgi:Domain of unknown function (DUF4401)
MSMKARELLSALGLPSGGTLPTLRPHVERPWYLSFMLGASGWVAGVCILIFVGVLFQPHSRPAFLFSGALLIAAAWGLYKADRDGAFAAQLALALSVAGQVLLVIGLTKDNSHIAGAAFAAFVIQTILVFIMPNALHRMLSALFACAALAVAVRHGLFPNIARYTFSGAESIARDLGPTISYSLAAWAITWLPVAALVYWLIRYEARWMARGWQAIARPALKGLIAGLAFATLISHPLEVFDWSARNATDRGWLALWPLLSALAAVSAIAAGFALRSRALMGAGIIGALLYTSHFYYALGTTLLTKSLIMLLMGGAMLGVAYFLKQRGEAE